MTDYDITISFTGEEEPPTAVNQGLELSDITLSESAEESSDASSCVEFFDDSDRRHDLLRRRRHRFLTEARRWVDL